MSVPKGSVFGRILEWYRYRRVKESDRKQIRMEGRDGESGSPCSNECRNKYKRAVNDGAVLHSTIDKRWKASVRVDNTK